MEAPQQELPLAACLHPITGAALLVVTPPGRGIAASLGAHVRGLTPGIHGLAPALLLSGARRVMVHPGWCQTHVAAPVLGGLRFPDCTVTGSSLLCPTEWQHNHKQPGDRAPMRATGHQDTAPALSGAAALTSGAFPEGHGPCLCLSNCQMCWVLSLLLRLFSILARALHN